MPMDHPLRKLTTRQLLARVFGMAQVKTSTQLHEAAKQGREDIVRQVIESHSELDESDEHGRSAFQVAAGSGCPQIFAMLIEAGATTNGPIIPPVTVTDICLGLLFAWLASKLRMPVPSLILRNLPIWVSAHLIALPTLYWLSAGLVFKSYPTVFSNARSIIQALSTFQGDTEYMFLLFLDSDTDLTVEENQLLWSQAVERGYTGVCQRLLRSGFPVDSLYLHCEYPDVVTALLHACGASHKELVLLLLSNGANPTYLDNHGRSCLIMASARPYTDHAGSVEDSDDILECLLKTDAIQHIDTPQIRSDSELADETLFGRHGWPLADASQNLRASAVHMLPQAGANPNLKTDSGWTALHAACRWHVPETIEIVRLLVRYSADVNAVSDLGWTPLGCAASIGQFVELVQILVESGAQLESTAGDASSLQVAARHDVSGGEVAKYLARNGADVNAVGGKFGSVLLATLERPCSFVLDEDRSIRLENDPSPQIIEFLLEFLEHGLNLNLVPEGWQSALEVAAQNNLPQVVSFLLERGAKLPSFKGQARARSSLDSYEIPSLPRVDPQTSILSHLQPYNHEMFSILLSHGVPPDADTIMFGSDSEMTVLGAACSSASEDYLRTATLLLEHGAEPNFHDMQGHLPIQQAAYAVSLGYLLKLIEYGASVQTDDDEYGSLLHSMCKGYARQEKVLRDSEAFLGCFRFLDQRLPHGSVWNQDGAGRNCLHYLAELSEETHLVAKVDGTFSQSQSSAIPILEEFLSVHGHPHPLERVPYPSLEVFQMADSDGHLAFHIASQKGDLHIMSLLVQHIESMEARYELDGPSKEDLISAIITQPDNCGWHALHHAASEGRAFACKYILEASEARAATALTTSGESAQDLANKNHHYGVADYITNCIAGIAGDENALRKAHSILATVVKKTVHLEFSEDQLLEVIRAESERHLLRGDI
ncbi:ankyrin [Hyaloscypha variabilis]